MNIGILTYGDKQSGMGHIMREIVLARELLDMGHGVSFLTLSPSPGKDRLTQEFMEDEKSDNVSIFGFLDMERLLKFTASSDYEDVLVIDLEHGPDRQLLERVREITPKVVVVGGVGFPIHDIQAVDELVDLQIFQAAYLNPGTSAVSNMLIGAEYLIIGEEYFDARNYRMNEIGSGILLTLGGGDPHNLTDEMYARIRNEFPNKWITKVYGAANDGRSRNEDNSMSAYAPGSLAPFMKRHSIIITALGMTVYEACCVGRPVACTGWSQDHIETANRLNDIGVVRSIGMWDNINYDALFQWIEFMQNPAAWNETRVRQMNLVDGLGARRVAEAICGLIG